MFEPFEGYKGDGSAIDIELNYNASSDGVAYDLNSASLMTYTRLDINATEIALGATDGTNQIKIIPRLSGVAEMQINSDDGIQETVATSLGMTSVVRTSASNIEAYRNAVDLDAAVNNSTVIPDNEVRLLSRDGSLLSNNQISFALIGGILDQAAQTAIFEAFEEYMDSNGKGVVTP